MLSASDGLYDYVITQPLSGTLFTTHCDKITYRVASLDKGYYRGDRGTPCYNDVHSRLPPYILNLLRITFVVRHGP